MRKDKVEDSDTGRRHPFLSDDGKSFRPVRAVRWVADEEERAFIEKLEKEKTIRLKKRYIFTIIVLVLAACIISKFVK